MLKKYLAQATKGYVVVKKRTDNGPLPSMIQYYLYSDQNEPLSFWNDIPLNLQNDVVNCVVEIPKQKHGKFQVKKHIANHPIMQDTRINIFSKQLQLRFYNQFPLFNYGYIPQTWEQNLDKDQLGHFGDDDPIDICDLSQVPKNPGDVFRGRVLGCFCLIDQGEIDWKIFVMDQEQSNKTKVSKIEDINPRKIEAIKKWFKIVKVPDGKRENHIAYNEKIFNKEETLDIIGHTRKQWINLHRSQQERVAAVRKKHCITSRKLDIDA